MSDKKFNFLNNPISCTITTIAWPVGGGDFKKCFCFDDKPIKSYRKLKSFSTIGDGDMDCLFQAAELARILSDKNVGEQNDDDVEIGLLRTKQRRVKQMMLQHEKLKKLGNSLKVKVLEGKQEDGKGFDVTNLIKVFFKMFIKNEFIFKIQQKYDEMHDRKYRLVLLNASNTIIYKAPLHAKIKFTLYLFFHCNHFDVLLNPGNVII